MKKVRKAVFPVAGMGTRFLPATKAMPKEMLTVVNRPVIQYAVEEALAAGIEELIFITGRGKSAIENHFDLPYELTETLRKKGKTAELESVTNIVPPHVRLVYTRQGAPLGLGHAIGCAAQLVGDEPFAVLLPDDILDAAPGQGNLADMVETYNKTGQSVVLCQEVPAEKTSNYGILDLHGAELPPQGGPVHGFVEKPAPEQAPSRYAVVGRYILTPAHFKHIAQTPPGKNGEIQLTDAMSAVCAEEGYQAQPFGGLRFDCGDKVGFQMANLHFAMKDPYIAPRLLPFLQDMAAQTERRKQKRSA